MSNPRRINQPLILAPGLGVTQMPRTYWDTLVSNLQGLETRKLSAATLPTSGAVGGDIPVFSSALQAYLPQNWAPTLGIGAPAVSGQLFTLTPLVSQAGVVIALPLGAALYPLDIRDSTRASLLHVEPGGSLVVQRNQTVGGNSTVSGDTLTGGQGRIVSNLGVSGGITTSGSLLVGSGLQVYGPANLNALTAAATTLNSLTVTGATALAALTLAPPPNTTSLVIYASGGTGIDHVIYLQQSLGSNAVRWNLNNQWLVALDLTAAGANDLSWYDNTGGQTRLFLRGNTAKTAALGVGTTNPQGIVSAASSADSSLFDTPQTYFIGHWADDPKNRAILLQSILGASTTRQYVMLNGMASGTTTAPTLNSLFAGSFGLESTDSTLSLITAAVGMGMTPIRGLSMDAAGNFVTAGGIFNAPGSAVFGATTANSLGVTGSTNLNVLVAGVTTLNSLNVTGSVTLGGLVVPTLTLNSLVVSGATNLGQLTAAAATLNSLTVTGSAIINGLFTAGASTLNSLTVSGLAILNGGLAVSGSTLLYGSASVTGTITVSPTFARCLTLNHANGFGGVTLAMNPASGTQRTSIKWASAFQTGTDLNFNGGADFWLQCLTTGNAVLTISSADLITLGSAAANGGVIVGVAGGKAAFYGGAPVAKPTLSGSVTQTNALVNLAGSLASLGLLTNTTNADDPTLPAFTWINQGSATVTNGTQQVFLNCPAASGDTLKLRVIAVPTGAYTMTMGFQPALPCANFLACGLCLYDSVSTKAVSLAVIGNTNYDTAGQVILASKWTTPTGFSADYTMTTNAIKATAWHGGSCMWLRLKDDGTTRTGWVSNDGVNFVQVFSTGHADFLTPTHIGFFINPNHAVYGAGMNVLSWSQA